MATLYRLLQRQGHEVFQAVKMQEALAAVPSANCDVLISCGSMPDGDGWDLLATLKKEGIVHPSYAIMMSGYGMEADIQRSKETGFRLHLVKPIELSLLTNALAEAAREIHDAKGASVVMC